MLLNFVQILVQNIKTLLILLSLVSKLDHQIFMNPTAIIMVFIKVCDALLVFIKKLIDFHAFA